MWTRFMDMHSGGSRKEEWEYIYIEAFEEEAKVIFYNRFGHDPEQVTCFCCGDDYSISESETLESVTAYDRGCRWDKEKNKYVDEADNRRSWEVYQTLKEYKKGKSALFIFESDIEDDERIDDLSDEGYEWV